MLSANEIAEFSNQLYFKKKIMNQLDFCHYHKIQEMQSIVCKILGGRGQKSSQTISFQDSKISYISLEQLGQSA